MAAPLYARYIPPKPVKTAQPAPVAQIDASDQQVLQHSEPERMSKKRKRSQPERKDGSQEVLPIVATPQQETRAGTTEPTIPLKGKKQKKVKKVKDQDQARETEAEEQARLAKHGAVLSKFQKSIQKADTSKADENGVKAKVPKPANLSIAPKQALEPIPQPVQDPSPHVKPTFSALPPWLAKPVIVTSDLTQSFEHLNISLKVLENLKKQELSQSFAVQAALLPLLLPGPDAYKGDLLVSAPTGSGKTLAYLLPLIERLKHKLTTKLRSVIVVPTRELVMQAKEAVELYASGTGLHIAAAVGNVSLISEQDALVEKYQTFDEQAAEQLKATATSIWRGDKIEDNHTLQDFKESLPKHVPAFRSKVDLLICTPGRLVEHLQSTRGFSLNDLEWLVIDEADRLLEEGFSEWVQTVMTAIQQRPLSLRQQMLFRMGQRPEPDRVRKTILSATMTRDLNKLSALKLYRPTLVAISDQAGNIIEGPQDPAETAEIIDLPSTLAEFAIPVGDGADKPLYLMQLLQTKVFPEMTTPIVEARKSIDRMDESDDSSDTSSSDSDSNSDSDASISSDSDSSLSESSVSSLSEDDSTSLAVKPPLRQKSNGTSKSTMTSTNVLIFTSNNENATRLAHLLQKLHPPYSPLIGTLTKSSATTESRRVLRQFGDGRLRILIASDRASRGLDVPSLSHVVNYDIPRNLSGYVHRVGRTARAGQGGTAWTLFTDSEGRWFWNEIARANSVRRGEGKVERVRLDSRVLDEGGLRDRYAEVLDGLRMAVQHLPASGQS